MFWEKRRVGDTCEDVGVVGDWIETMTLCCQNEREMDTERISAFWCTGKQEILSGDDEGLDVSFGGIVVHLNAAIRKKGL